MSMTTESIGSNTSLSYSDQRLDYAHIKSKNWAVFEADKKRLGKKCYFKNAQRQKPIYAIGHNSHLGRTAPKFVPAKNIRMLTDSTDIAGKVRDKLSFGEIQPLFMVGPTKGPFENKLNTFDNLFGGSLETVNSLPNIQQAKADQQTICKTASKRTIENSKTKSRIILGIQHPEYPAGTPHRTGLKMIPNKCNQESDYWLTTFRGKRGDGSDPGSDSLETFDDGTPTFREEGDHPKSQGSRTPPSAAKQAYKFPPSPHGALSKILKRLIEEDQRPIEPSELPLYLQGLKRSENGWYRKISKHH